MILALAVSAVGALSEGRALASHVSCGEVITTDTTLDSDLINCPNNGIIVGANGVTLNLNGHLVDGDGTNAAGCDPNAAVCDTGVVDDGHDGVTVMHGRVRQFGVGVLVGTSSAGKVKHNRVLGISSIRNRFLGFGIFSSIGSLVRNSSGSRATARHGGVGIALGDSREARILHNTFRRNSDHGIFVADASGSLIKRNLFSRTATGIFLLDSDRDRVLRNRVIRSGEAILLDGGGHDVIARNRVARVGGRGKGGDGIGAEGGRSHLIADNLVVDAHGNGIRIGLVQPPAGALNTVVRGNRVKGSGKDGFVVEPKSKHSLLARNVARNNGDDGFDIESRTTSLTRNRAIGNLDLGFEAVSGVIDGGGNIARLNGDPRQCTHILCS